MLSFIMNRTANCYQCTSAVSENLISWSIWIYSFQKTVFVWQCLKDQYFWHWSTFVSRRCYIIQMKSLVTKWVWVWFYSILEICRVFCYQALSYRAILDFIYCPAFQVSSLKQVSGNLFDFFFPGSVYFVYIVWPPPPSYHDTVM